MIPFVVAALLGVAGYVSAQTDMVQHTAVMNVLEGLGTAETEKKRVITFAHPTKP
jgi:hypothetical protein